MFFPEKYDVFISYAIEDKYPVAESIASYLKKKGIKVWYVGHELKVGDKISSVIYKGLKNSKYGIVILSPSYTRQWTIVEFFAFLEMEELEKKELIFPVWHKIDYETVKTKYPQLVNRYALSTDSGLENISIKIDEAIRKNKRRDRFSAIKRLTIVAFILVTCFAMLTLLYQKYSPEKAPSPSKSFVESAVQKRIVDYEHKLKENLQQEIVKFNARIIISDSAVGIYNHFIKFSNAERNEYSFSNDWTSASGRKNIRALGIPFSAVPYNNYDITAPKIWLLKKNYQVIPDTSWSCSLAFTDTIPATFRIDTTFHSNQKVNVQVSYKRNIRVVYCSFTYSSQSHLKKQQVQIFGFKPEEEYIFEMQNGNWKLSEVR